MGILDPDSDDKDFQPHVWALLLAGGTGQRFVLTESTETVSQQSAISKLTTQLAGEPVLAWSLKALIEGVKPLAGLVIVAHPEWQDTYKTMLEPVLKHYPDLMVLWVDGGRTRRDSVMNGLMCLPKKANAVVIHDGARPLVKPSRIQLALTTLLQQAPACYGTTLAIPCQNSLKLTDAINAPYWVKRTQSRAGLWQIHTPQCFLLRPLLDAHINIPDDPDITDDCELLERAYPNTPLLQLVTDDVTNIKITTPADLKLAQAYALLERSSTSIRN